MSFYSVRISFILINHYVISFRFTSSRKSSNMIYSLLGYLVRLCLGKDTFFYSGVIYPRPSYPIISLLHLKAFRNQNYEIQSLLLFLPLSISYDYFLIVLRRETTSVERVTEQGVKSTSKDRKLANWVFSLSLYRKLLRSILQFKCRGIELLPHFIILWIFFRFSHGPRKLQMSRWLRILPTSHIMRQILEMW